MKTLIALALLALSSQAFSADLNCQVIAGDPNGYIAQNFQMIDIETQFPDVTEFDGGNMADDRYPLTFSNECDNWVEIDFPGDSFELIKQGQINEINGSMYYASAEFDETTPGVVPSPHNDDE